MNKDKEYYSTNEFNQTKEYSPFPAEEYKTPDECLKKGEEFKYVEEENNLNTVTNKSKSDIDSVKKATENASENASTASSANTAATTVAKISAGVTTAVVGTVAAATVLSPIITPSPEFKIDEIYTGDSYAYYSVYADGFQDGFNYSVKIRSSKQEFEFSLNEGSNENVIDGLLPGYEYTISFVGTSKNSTKIEYKKEKFYTLGENLPKIDFDIKETKNSHGLFDIDYSVSIVDRWEKFDGYKIFFYESDGNLLESQSIESGCDGFFKGSIPSPKNGTVRISVFGNLNGKQIYVSGKDYLFNSQPDKIPIPEIYGASFKKPPASDIKITYAENGDYILNFKTDFENPTKDNFVYRIKVVGRNGYSTFCEGSDKEAFVTVDKSLASAKIIYEEVGYFAGEEKVYSSFEAEGELHFTPKVYTASFNKVSNKDIITQNDKDGNYILTFNTNFENKSEHDLYYRITVSTVQGLTQTYVGRDRVANITLSQYERKVKIKYEELGKIDGQEKVFGVYENENPFILIPQNYSASFRKVPCKGVTVTWDQGEFNKIEVPVQFNNNSGHHFSYRVTAYNDSGYSEVFEGTDMIATLMIDKNVPSVKLKYEEIGFFEGITKVYNTYYAEGEVILEAPVLTLGDSYSYGRDGSLTIPFVMHDKNPPYHPYGELDVEITTSDGTVTRSGAYMFDANEENNLIIRDLPLGCATMKVKCTLHMQGNYGDNPRDIVFPEKEYVLKETFELMNAEVMTEYQEARLAFAYYGDAASQIIVKNTATGANYGVQANVATVPLSAGEVNVEYCLADSNGTPISPVKSLKLLPDVKAQYTFNYKNPSEVLKTYNPDSTFNLYFDLDYSCNDPDVYYEIALTKGGDEFLTYKMRDKVAIIENLSGTYGIIYRVCKDINGVKYVFADIPVSGSTDEEVRLGNHMYEEGADKDTLKINLDIGRYTYDLSSAEVTFSDGTVYKVPESDFVQNPNMGYELSVPVDKYVTFSTFKIKLHDEYALREYENIKNKVTVKGDVNFYAEFRLDRI